VPSAAFAPATPRVSQRNADATSDTGAAAAPAAGLAAAKDDGSATGASRAGAPAIAANGNNVGFSQNTAATPAAAIVKLAGAPEQWQQPLREALGDRLQVQLQRNNEHAVIRLEPPNMGSIEISIRQSGGSLQVNLTANHSEVVRQLNTIGDSVRQDLSTTRQFGDVAVTVNSSRAQAQADGGGRNQQQRDQDEGRTPGRALSDDGATSTFAMTSERE
jgi:flagellar hook-length control protein FliK